MDEHCTSLVWRKKFEKKCLFFITCAFKYCQVTILVLFTRRCFKSEHVACMERFSTYADNVYCQGRVYTWKLTTHSSESTLARSKGRDLSRTLIKCYYLTYIYKFIYYISYDGRHFSSTNKKNTVFFFWSLEG